VCEINFHYWILRLSHHYRVLIDIQPAEFSSLSMWHLIAQKTLKMSQKKGQSKWELCGPVHRLSDTRYWSKGYVSEMKICTQKAS